MRRRHLLLAMAGMALAMGGAERPTGLQALAAKRGLVWGSALSHTALADAGLAALLLENVGTITPENALKWEATEPEPDRFDFRPVDRILAFAQQNGLSVRGHTLVWHHQLPPWLEELPAKELEKAMERHVRTVAALGRGLIRSWDVVNEPIAEHGAGLRRSLWLVRLGPAFISHALCWARLAAPGAQLIINEYGLEGDDPITARKRSTLLALIDRLRRDQIPLDGIGLQAHLLAPGSGSPQFTTLASFLQELHWRGLKVQITELDVSDRELPADIAVRDARVAETYDRFLEVVLREPCVEQITTWGLSDRDSWLNSTFPRSDGLPQRPLPYDEHLRAKPLRSIIAARLIQTTPPMEPIPSRRHGSVLPIGHHQG